MFAPIQAHSPSNRLLFTANEPQNHTYAAILIPQDPEEDAQVEHFEYASPAVADTFSRHTQTDHTQPEEAVKPILRDPERKATAMQLLNIFRDVPYQAISECFAPFIRPQEFRQVAQQMAVAKATEDRYVKKKRKREVDFPD